MKAASPDNEVKDPQLESEDPAMKSESEREPGLESEDPAMKAASSDNEVNPGPSKDEISPRLPPEATSTPPQLEVTMSAPPSTARAKLQNAARSELRLRHSKTQSVGEASTSSEQQPAHGKVRRAGFRVVEFCQALVSATAEKHSSNDSNRTRSFSGSALATWASTRIFLRSGARDSSSHADSESNSSRIRTPRVPQAEEASGDRLQFCRGGQIQWNSGVTDFCIIPHTADPQDFMNSQVYRQWVSAMGEKKQPNLVVSVMGGAGHMDQESSTYDTFKQGIVSAAMKTGAWIFTGGTANGVMDLVGRAMKKHDKQREVPCIGVAAYGSLTPSWRKLLHRHLDDTAAMDVNPPEPNKDADKDPDTKVPLAHLQQNHTHMILCQSEKYGSAAFGTEVEFRVALEKHLGKSVDSKKKEKKKSGGSSVAEVASQVITNFEVPRVMILVNGGGVSLFSVDNAIKSGCPVVCVQGSGRAADAIISFIEGEKIEDAWNHMNPEKLDDNKKEMLLRIKESNCVQVHSSNDRLEDVILRAVLDSESPELGPQGLLSASWHRLVLAVQWRSESYYEKLVQHLIKYSRSMCKDFAQDQLQDGINLATQLLFNGFVGENRFNIAHIDQHMNLHERTAGLNIVPILEFLLKNHKFQLENFRVDDHTLGHIEWKDFDVKFKGLPGLLVWAVEQEAPENLLDCLWTHTPHPVHAALVAASACRNIAEIKHAHKSYSNDLAKKRLESVAERFEKLAVQVLEDLAAANIISPVDYLFEPSMNWGIRDCFHIAIDLDCKDFVASKFYRMAVDRYHKTPSPFASNKNDMLKDLSWISIFLAVTNLKKSNLTLEKFYRVPYIKAMTHAISRIVFIVTYSYAVFSGCFITDHTHWAEMFLFIFGISLARIEYKQYIAKKSFAAYIDFWNGLDCLHITVLLATITVGQFLKDASATSSREEYGLEVVHSLNLLPSFARLLQVLFLSEYFGTLVLTVAGMITDAAYFFVLLSIFCMMFSCALTPILFQQSETRQSQGLTWAFWSIFGEVNEDARKQLDGQWQSVGLREFARVLLYSLCLVSNVLLMNLLIAVMGSTYERNKENSEKDFAFYQATAWIDFDDDVSFLPPPLNLLEDIDSMVHALRGDDDGPEGYGNSQDHEREKGRATRRSQSGLNSEPVTGHRRSSACLGGPSSTDFTTSAKKAIAALSTEGKVDSEFASLKQENEELKQQISDLRRLADLERNQKEEVEGRLTSLEQSLQTRAVSEVRGSAAPRQPDLRRTESSAC